MELQVTQKGALYSAECAKCGATIFAHEWASWDPNELRDAMESGGRCCKECGGCADPETFSYIGKHYAARYSMPGYLDCTEWTYGTNKRALIRDVRRGYGEE